MLIRNYQPINLVTLPRQSAPDTIALATALVSRGRRAGPLPESIDKGLIRVEVSLQGAHVATSAIVEDMSAEGTAVSLAGGVLQASWGACRDWCKGWLRLPNQPVIHVKAERVYTALFTGGLGFTQRKYHIRWVESQARLDIIVEQELEPIFIELGGQLILSTLRDAHAAYGEALGLTAPVDSVQTRGEAVRILQDEMRRYVVRVCAHMDPDDPATEALAENLLLPLTTWQPSASSTAESTEDSGDADQPSETDNQPEPAEPTAPAMLFTDLTASAPSGEITLS